MRKSGVDKEPADFAAFYQQSRDGCLRAVYASVGDLLLAEDLVAEAYSRAWACWRKVGRHPAPQAWIVRTALNTHVSWWRRQRREVAWDGHDGAGTADVAAAHDEATRPDEQVLDAIRGLPLRQREVIALRVFPDPDTQARPRPPGIWP